MTCIVGLLNDGNVYIGGDSAGVRGFDLSERKDEKVFQNGEFIFGFTSSFRMGQLLRYSFIPPTYYSEYDIYKFMVVDFVDAVRTCLKNGGYAEKDKGVEQGGIFIVGFKGKLFTIESDYQVAEQLDPYFAVGCGDCYAKGCLFATEGIKMKPEDRVIKALESAEKYSAGVTSPFHIVNL